MTTDGYNPTCGCTDCIEWGDHLKTTRPRTHFRIAPFTAACGANDPNQITTDIPEHVTCIRCVFLMSVKPKTQRDAVLEAVDRILSSVEDWTGLGTRPDHLRDEWAGIILSRLNAVREPVGWHVTAGTLADVETHLLALQATQTDPVTRLRTLSLVCRVRTALGRETSWATMIALAGLETAP